MAWFGRTARDGILFYIESDGRGDIVDAEWRGIVFREELRFYPSRVSPWGLEAMSIAGPLSHEVIRPRGRLCHETVGYCALVKFQGEPDDIFLCDLCFFSTQKQVVLLLFAS